MKVATNELTIKKYVTDGFCSTMEVYPVTIDSQQFYVSSDEWVKGHCIHPVDMKNMVVFDTKLEAEVYRKEMIAKVKSHLPLWELAMNSVGDTCPADIELKDFVPQYLLEYWDRVAEKDSDRLDRLSSYEKNIKKLARGYLPLGGEYFSFVKISEILSYERMYENNKRFIRLSMTDGTKHDIKSGSYDYDFVEIALGI